MALNEEGTARRNRRRAAEMLTLATVFWGLSFPVMKALGLLHAAVIPSASTWFSSASAIVLRFALSAVLMLLWSWRSLGTTTRSEVWQGVGLGFFGGVGLLFQMDGLNYTSASTSAFLTQCYCIFLPFYVAARDRRRPSGLLLICAALVVLGVGVLADVDWREWSMGRGEWETLIGSLLFTGQILWLEKPEYSANRVEHFSLVMFGTIALIMLPVALVTGQGASEWIAGYATWTAVLLMGVLVLACTMISYVLMNMWQRHLPVAEAGMIYAAEPVFASLFALFLPALFSKLGGFNYENERLTLQLFAGGGLICAANLLVQWKGSRPAPGGTPEPNSQGK